MEDKREISQEQKSLKSMTDGYLLLDLFQYQIELVHKLICLQNDFRFCKIISTAHNGESHGLKREGQRAPFNR